VTDPGDPEFNFGAATPGQSQVDFDSGWQFLQDVTGQQLFEVTAMLSVTATGVRTNSVALADFFNTGTVNLMAQTAPPPATAPETGTSIMLGIAILGFAGYSQYYRRQQDTKTAATSL
jgi:hypothetical protein